MTTCQCRPYYTGPYIAGPYVPTLKEFKEHIERMTEIVKCEECRSLRRRVEELEGDIATAKETLLRLHAKTARRL